MSCCAVVWFYDFSALKEFVRLNFIDFGNLTLKLLIQINISWDSSILGRLSMCFNLVDVFKNSLI